MATTQVDKQKNATVATPSRAVKKRSGWYLVLIAILLIVAGAVWWVTKGHTTSSASQSLRAGQGTPSASAADQIQVDVVHPKKGGMGRTTTQPGSVQSFQYADLYAKVSGYLKEQAVDIGDHVQKGMLLAVIDDPEIVKEADRAAAALELSRSQVKQSEAAVKSAQAAQLAAEADIAKYTADRKFREKEYARIYNLFYKQNAVDEKLVDESLERKEAAIAAERSAKAQLEVAVAKIDQARADLAAAKSNVQVDEANLAKAQVLVDYTKITSPYDGVITKRNFYPGEFVRSASEGNEQPLLRVDRTDKMRVIVQVPDTDVPLCDPGDPAAVRIEALGKSDFRGKVARLADAEDPQTRTMRTEIDLPNPEGKLRDGMYGGVTILLEPPSDNLTIPDSCLVGKSSQGEATVFVVQNGKAQKVQIRIGADNGIEVEVLKGLSAEDEVILPHNTTITDGEPVVASLAKEKSQAEAE